MKTKTTRRPLAILAGGIASFIALTTVASAATNWIGNTSTDWNDGSNWAGGLAPGSAPDTNAYIGSLGGGNPPYTATITANIANVNDLQIARGGGPALVNHTAGSAAANSWIDVGTAGGTGTYNVADVNSTGGTLTGFGVGTGSVSAGGRLYVGGVAFDNGGGTGNMNINTSGTVNISNRLYVGMQNGNGTVKMDGGTLAIGNDLGVGVNNGVGVFNMSLGTVTTGGWNFIGKRDGDNGSALDGGNGTLIMSGGTLGNGGGRTYVGSSNSVGSVQMSGNAIYSQTGDFRVGQGNLSNASMSTVTLAGNSRINSGYFQIGGNDDGGGKGRVTVSGATAVLNSVGEIWVGDNGATSNGELNVSAGTVQASSWIAIGRANATGVLNLSGGSVIKNGDGNNHIIIGSINGNGTINQTGGNLMTTAGDIRMGEGSSVAVWDMSGGTASTGSLKVAWNGGTNELKVRGSAQLTVGNLEVGEASNNGSGLITQTGGTVTSNSWTAIGNGSTQTSRYNISGGTLNTGGLEAGSDTTGIINLSAAGIINITNDLEVPTRNGNGTVNVSGGTLNASNYMQGGRDGQTGTGASFVSGGNVNLSGNLIVQRPAVGTGAFTLSGGTLAVNGNLDATLGTFTFTGGRITRSNAGIINYLGNLTTGNSAAGFKLDADKTFAISGAFNISNGISFDINGRVIPAYSGSGVDTGSFTLGTEASIIGTYGALNTILAGLSNLASATLISETAGEATTYNPLTDSVYWLQDNAGITTLQYSVVPEPASLGLIACTMLGGAFLRRRRR